MRLWSLHPRLLDRAALVAGWREGLLAQKVLSGGTVGYRHHPQLERFRGPRADSLVAAWLAELAVEAEVRGYRFDRTRIIADPAESPALTVTSEQLRFEFGHLRHKVAGRAPDWLPRVDEPEAHPLFTVVEGPVELWERGT